MILSAENPFVFTAFCLNMREIHYNPDAVINTPIFLDATCSGIQHVAGLMRDIELGANTNLKPSNNETDPEDIYSYLLNIINAKVNEFGEDNLEYAKLSEIKLERKHVKAPIMTKVYNVTKYGISRQLQAALAGDDSQINNINEERLIELNEEVTKSLDNKKISKKERYYSPIKNSKKLIELSQKEIFKIAQIIDEQIFVIFPSLNHVYKYFIEMANLSTLLGIPLNWVTPNGLEITQNYMKSKKSVVTINLFGKSKKIILKNKSDLIDKLKQKQAIIPNIIHSLDACHLNNIISKAEDNNFSPVITVHDCFGTLANQMGQLDYMVKKEFILLYSQNKFLEDFHNKFISTIENNNIELITEDDKSYVLYKDEYIEIPKIPELGKLDLENIIQSKYMISQISPSLH